MLCSVLFVSHRSKLTHLFVLRYSFLVDSWHLTCTSPSYFILCVTLWRFIRGERLCLHCIEKLCDQIWWSSTEDHVIQYCRSCDPYRRSCDQIQEIMWPNTRSCDPIQEIMWSNTRDHVTQYKRSCDLIPEIMWSNIRDAVQKIMWSNIGDQSMYTKLDFTTTSKNRKYYLFPHTVTQYG